MCIKRVIAKKTKLNAKDTKNITVELCVCENSKQWKEIIKIWESIHSWLHKRV